MQVLVIEDDATLNKNICTSLQSENYQTTAAFDGQIALRLLQKNSYQAVVLDVNLPGINGFEVCKALRKINNKVLVLLLTSFSEIEDKVKGFECGADDYLTKPFFMRELLLRLDALRRRSQVATNVISNILYAGDLKIDLKLKTVMRNDQVISLTPREFQILKHLCSTPGEIVSKEALIETIWGNSVGGNTNTIEVYMNFLRNKVDKPFGKKSIKTKVGYGYYFDSSSH
ncbi:MAG: response regulator transcription factor [Schleiferiaceae bacterium]|nr:response regulator transcription factor [Schleiferiaceae bacterium]